MEGRQTEAQSAYNQGEVYYDHRLKLKSMEEMTTWNFEGRRRKGCGRTWLKPLVSPNNKQIFAEPEPESYY